MDEDVLVLVIRNDLNRMERTNTPYMRRRLVRQITPSRWFLKLDHGHGRWDGSRKSSALNAMALLTFA